jgi:flagellar motor switch protein FliM
MTGPSANHLGRAKIGQLLAAIGSTHAQDPAPPAATPYDWRDPHCFAANQQNRLVQALEHVAGRMAEIFRRSRGRACEVSLKSLTQHFAGDLCRRLELDQDYCLAFAPEKGPMCGFASIRPSTALAWVTWLLGDADAARDPNRALSALEESLLSDLLTALLGAFLAPLQAQHHLTPAGNLSKGQPTIQFELTEEICRMVFQIKSEGPGEPAELAVVVPAGRLAVLAGKPAVAAPAKVAPQELSRALMEHVQQLSVTVRATLASITLTFQEILDLAPGDILLLDKPVSGLAELTAEGCAVFRGRPVRAQGRCAVVLTELETADRPPAATLKGSK